MEIRPKSLEIILNSKGKIPSIYRKTKLDKHGIYIFYHKDKLIRVGESGSGFKRIYNGFSLRIRRKNNKRTSAYSWRKYYCNEKVTLDYFSLEQLGEKAKRPEIRRAIEAEVTYQIRTKTKKWPLRMTEIHFSEKLSKNGKIKYIVKEIMSGLKIK